MSPLKHNLRKTLLCTLALPLLSALLSSCARTEQPTEVKKDAAPRPQANINPAEVDRALARAASEALGDREGAVLVMDPHNGRVRAVVNPRLAYEQAFPPGSTIKSFTALSAMRAGLVDRESRIQCRGRFKGDAIDITCSHPKSNSQFNLSHALGYSCNYFFATMSGRLSFDAFRATLASAGLGAKTGINATSESAGVLREGDWRVRDLLGEGDNLLVTPVQLLTAYCALMNGGHLFRPQVSDDAGLVGEERNNIRVSGTQRTPLIEGMRGAVVYGTAERSGLATLPGFVFGKTGTSTASNGFRRQGWFVSFIADAKSAAEVTPESLELSVLVFIKRSHGSDAALVSRGVYQEFLKLTRGVAEEQPQQDAKAQRSSEGTNIRVKLLSENRIVTMPLEEYVLGVLSVEAAVEDESEALKAQAIVSRTYAVKNLKRHESEGFDLCSNTHCQQYVSADSRTSEKMRKAVSDTAGEILLDSSGQTADAYFHASCGGYTASFESLWGEPGPSYLRGVPDDFCATMPNRQWTDEIAATKLAKALASDPLTDAGKLNDIVVAARDNTGRAEIILIEGERRKRIRGWDFKLIVGRTLGWNLLKSSRFTVNRRGPTFVFHGSGFGHGLGLCQSGAHVMARRGSSFEQILNKYFPGTKIGGERPPDRASLDAISLSNVSLHSDDNTKRLTLSSEHFRVNYPVRTPRASVDAVLRTLEAARLDMLARAGAAGLKLPDTVEVVIHATTQDFVAATGQSVWAAGVTHGRRIEVQPLPVLERRGIFSSTLRHEYAHAVMESNGRADVPRWLAEGLAIAFAGEGRMYARFRGNARLSIEDLERRLQHQSSAAEMRSLYAAAYFETMDLIRREGEPATWRRIGKRI
jgi:SpoIID/LytB domain protein